MKIDLKKEEKKLTIKLDGKLDTNTSPELDSKMSELEGVEEVVIDMIRNNPQVSMAAISRETGLPSSTCMPCSFGHLPL